MNEVLIPQIYTVILPKEGNRVVEYNFRLPDNANKREHFLKNLENAKDDQGRFKAAEKEGLKLCDTYQSASLTRFGKMEFALFNGQYRIREAVSYDNGDITPYRNNPHNVCAMTFTMIDSKGKFATLDTVGLFANSWEKKETDLRYTQPDQKARQYFLTENALTMELVRSLQPGQNNSFGKPAYDRAIDYSKKVSNDYITMPGYL